MDRFHAERKGRINNRCSGGGGGWGVPKVSTGWGIIPAPVERGSDDLLRILTSKVHCVRGYADDIVIISQGNFNSTVIE